MTNLTAQSHDFNPLEFPTVNEGFSLVTVKPAIVCNTPYKVSTKININHN